MHLLPIFLDVLALLIVALFATVGASRGALRGVLRIVSALAAFGLAVLAAPRLVPSLTRSIGLSSGAAHVCAIVVLTAVLLLGFALALRRFDPSIEKARLGLADRMLGALLGMAAGGALVLGVSALALRNAPPEARFASSLAASRTGALALGAASALGGAAADH